MNIDIFSSEPNDKWLDAYSDRVASLYTFTQCMTLSDIQADGDYKLIIADLGTGSYDMKLKVYKSEWHKILLVWSCLSELTFLQYCYFFQQESEAFCYFLLLPLHLRNFLAQLYLLKNIIVYSHTDALDRHIWVKDTENSLLDSSIPL